MRPRQRRSTLWWCKWWRQRTPVTCWLWHLLARSPASPHRHGMAQRRSPRKPPSLRSGWDQGARFFPMNSRRDFHSHRAALFDGIEEGGLRSSTYSSHEIHEHENDRAMDSLHDRVSILKRLTGDIHEEVENHNRMLDRMGNDMDASRGFLSGTVDKFKMDGLLQWWS